jgi:hypothetical protein
LPKKPRDSIASCALAAASRRERLGMTPNIPVVPRPHFEPPHN